MRLVHTSNFVPYAGKQPARYDLNERSTGDALKDIERIISELEQQKSAIERALSALREITGLGTVTAGRDGQVPAVKKKRRMSAAGRRRIAEGVRKRWAARKRAQAAASKQSASVSNEVAPAKKARRKKARAKKSAARSTATASPSPAS